MIVILCNIILNIISILYTFKESTYKLLLFNSFYSLVLSTIIYLLDKNKY